MSWGYNTHHGDYSEQVCIVYLKFTKSVDGKSSHHKKNQICNYVRWWMLTKLIVVIILNIYIY